MVGEDKEVILITRADDMGYTHTGNLAILDCFCDGFVKVAVGVHLLIAHPGYPSLENDALVRFEPKDVKTLGVGNLRASEALAYTSLRIISLVERHGIRLMSYRHSAIV